MLTPEVTGNIRVLMERVSLTGKEVPIFNRIMLELAREDADFAASRTPPPPPEPPKSPKEA